MQSGQVKAWCPARTKCVLAAAGVSTGHRSSWRLKAVSVLVVSWFLPTPWSQCLLLQNSGDSGRGDILSGKPCFEKVWLLCTGLDLMKL